MSNRRGEIRGQVVSSTVVSVLSNLETALGDVEAEADATVRALTAALRDAKKAKAAAASGELRELRNALDGSARLTGLAADVAAKACASWTFDEQAYFSDGHYAAEVLALAAESGHLAFESDERILSYPAIVQLVASDTSVLIDRRKERRVRPTVLVKVLRNLQAKPPKFKAEAFIESLASAYDLVIGKSGGRPGSIMKLVDLYAALTLLPGSGRDYTKAEFARDLYLLDQSGVTTTRNARTLTLPASALTRGSGVLTTVTKTGQEKVYAGICFEGPST